MEFIKKSSSNSQNFLINCSRYLQDYLDLYNFQCNLMLTTNIGDNVQNKISIELSKSDRLRENETETLKKGLSQRTVVSNAKNDENIVEISSIFLSWKVEIIIHYRFVNDIDLLTTHLNSHFLSNLNWFIDVNNADIAKKFFICYHSWCYKWPRFTMHVLKKKSLLEDTPTFIQRGCEMTRWPTVCISTVFWSGTNWSTVPTCRIIIQTVEMARIPSKQFIRLFDVSAARSHENSFFPFV